jgi:protein-disulfide isomerase
VLVAISVGGEDDAADGDANLAGVGDATALYAGIPQNGLVIGTPSAPVTIDEYLDLQCPACARASTSIVPQLVTRFVRTGQAKLVLHATDLVAGADSRLGARALFAAGEQSHAAEFEHVLFANQGEERSGSLNDTIITDAAKSLGMNVAALDAARASTASDALVDEVNATMRAKNYTTTPTFIITGPAGQYRVANPMNLSEFVTAIDGVK